MLQLTEDGGKIVPVELFSLAATAFGATQQTPTLYQGHIYGVRPDGQQTSRENSSGQAAARTSSVSARS